MQNKMSRLMSLFGFEIEIVVTNGLGCRGHLSNSLLQSAKSSNCIILEGTSQFMHLDKLGTLAPCTDSLRPVVIIRE
jgi:hypothetical protein